MRRLSRACAQLAPRLPEGWTSRPSAWLRLLSGIPLPVLLPLTLLGAPQGPGAPPPAHGDGTPIRPLVVGGEPAPSGEYPFMAAILWSTIGDPYNAQFCSGILIAENWVLTAAHCVDGVYPSQLEVFLSDSLLQRGEGIRVPVLDVRIHPDYDPLSYENDLCLLLIDDWQPEGHVAPAPIRLPGDATLPDPGTLLRVLGWGAVDAAQQNFPFDLQMADVPLVEQATGEAVYGPSPESQFFAGFAEGGVNTCKADSGGPVLLRNPETEDWELIGVTSYGLSFVDCDAPANYGVYTRLGSALDWLHRVLTPTRRSWEQRTGLRADQADADLDELSNWQEFAFGTDPNFPDRPPFSIAAAGKGRAAFSWSRLAEPNEVAFRWETSSDLIEWHPLEPADEDLVNLDHFSRAGLRYESGQLILEPSATGTFVRLAAEPSMRYVPVTEEIALPRVVYGRLHKRVDQDPDGGYFRRFVSGIDDRSAGQWYVSLRSPDMPTELAVIQQGEEPPLEVEVLETLPEARLLAVTVQAGDRLILEVRSRDPESLPTGDFRLALFQPRELPPAPWADVLEGELSEEDASRPGPTPLPFYFDEFDFALAPSLDRAVIRLQSEDFDPFLAVIDVETGQAVAQNDDANVYTHDAWLSFPVPEHSELRRYHIRVGSFSSGVTGAYRLQVGPMPRLTVGGSVIDGRLDTEDPADPLYTATYFSDDYLLEIPEDTRTVQIQMSALQFDAYLILLDATSGQVLARADADDPAGIETITFTPALGRSYLVRATSFGEIETGDYRLKAFTP